MDFYKVVIKFTLIKHRIFRILNIELTTEKMD
jgi:hypothetical protein